jgi:dolichol kinase
MTYWDEINRKSIHLGSSVFSLLYWFTDKPIMLRVMIPLVTFSILVETLRQYVPAVQASVQRWLGKILRVEEKKLFTGATYVAIGVLLCVLMFPESLKKMAIAVMLFLSISDALASLVGIKFGRARFLGKSLAGSAAFLLSAVAIATLVLWGESASWRVIGLVGAVVATVTEAITFRWGEFKLDDNFSIPLVSGGVMVGLVHLI